MALIVTLLALGAIIALHELGHFLTARACGMRVERYSIGFGPVLLSFRRGETEYALSMLPFGGYVKIAGMNPQEPTAADDPGSYASKPAWKRFLVLFAGPLSNYLIAFVLLSGLYRFGMPSPAPVPTIGEVLPLSPAAMAGLKPDDVFLSIGGKKVESFEAVASAVQDSGGRPIAIQIRRASETLTFEVTPQPEGGTYRIGASPKLLMQRLPLGASIVAAGKQTLVSNVLILVGLADAVRSRGKVELGGTVAAVADTTRAAHLGAAPFLLTVSGLSIVLALFNLLPIPGLDGGRLLFVVVEMIRRRPVNPRLETALHAAGVLALLGLMVVLTISDVKKLRPRPAAIPSGDGGALEVK